MPVPPAGFLLQYFALPIGLAACRGCCPNISFTLAAFCLAGAIVARYGGEGALCGAWACWACGGLAGFSWFMFVDPDLTWRIFAINFAFGGISLVVAAEMRAVREQGADRADPDSARAAVRR